MAIQSWTFGGDPHADAEKLYFPGLVTIEHRIAALQTTADRYLLTSVYRSDATGPALASGVDPKWIFAVVPADHRIDLSRLTAASREHFNVRIKSIVEEPSEDWPVGFLGPHAAMRAADAVLIVDPSAAQHYAWCTGGNDKDFLLRGFNWFRECGDRLADLRKTAVAEIAET